MLYTLIVKLQIRKVNSRNAGICLITISPRMETLYNILRVVDGFKNEDALARTNFPQSIGRHTYPNPKEDYQKGDETRINQVYDASSVFKKQHS